MSFDPIERKTLMIQGKKDIIVGTKSNNEREGIEYIIKIGRMP